ncbi:hypothetical protein [Burkholderia gladioli]|uniref:Uncharacterized protein n=1 Tax=Burkholderia gladioli (strain BSR3) TaxID=999541 RepID=F2LSW2_BURGS|nr:hypothetical protein [Burkholderia gladioli]AEA65982.1 hypothetical protein bgla_4p2170 [Burkholderia gladioli BSR3]MBW5286913.1 hypothetical protein [Burkholderia gladioli]
MEFEPALTILKTTPTQMAMTGDDWLSDRDRNARAAAEAKRKKAAIACARKLEAASEALSQFFLACIECQDASTSRGDDDGRRILMRNITEYAGYLSSVYDK